MSAQIGAGSSALKQDPIAMRSSGCAGARIMSEAIMGVNMLRGYSLIVKKG
jgi:hypothetical protein